MKNIIILIALCNIISLLSNETPYNIYIENYSSLSIACDVNNRSQEIIIPSHSKPIKLIDPHEKNIITPHQITDVTIRSDSYFSYPQPLTKYLNQLCEESTQNKNKDAILIINQSGYLSDWNIKISWRNANSFLTSFSMETDEDEVHTKERQFQIKKISTAKDFLKLIEEQNLYGLEYADKVKELRTIDYESLQKKHSKNIPIFLKLHSFGFRVLLTTINHIQSSYQDYLRYPERENTQLGNCTPEEVKTKIKEIIDDEYQLFLTYKANGWLD